MIKLIVSDIDGTLIQEGGSQLNPEYFEVIRALEKKGVQFVAASGRNVVSMRKVLSPLANDIWMLSQNGSVLVKGQETIVPKPIPKEWIETLWKEISALPDADIMTETPFRTFAPYEGTPMFRFIKDEYKYDIHATGSPEIVPDETFSMVALYHPVNAEVFFGKHLNPIWKERFTLLTTGVTWINLVVPGSGKGLALKKIAEEMNIAPEEILAFGDNLNDIDMMKYAGTCMTVEDARDEVKEIADKVLPSYHEDGVLQELKALLASME